MAFPVGWTTRWNAAAAADWNEQTWTFNTEPAAPPLLAHNVSVANPVTAPAAIGNDAFGEHVFGRIRAKLRTYSEWTSIGVGLRMRGTVPATARGYYFHAYRDGGDGFSRLAVHKLGGGTTALSAVAQMYAGQWFNLEVEADHLTSGLFRIWFWHEWQERPAAPIEWTDPSPDETHGLWGVAAGQWFYPDWDREVHSVELQEAPAEPDPPDPPTPPVYCAPDFYELTIFGDDDVTPLVGTVDGSGNVTEASYSTSPAHPRAWLDAPPDGADTRLNLPSGTSEIGQINLTLLDRSPDPCDPGAGAVTALISDAAGFSAWLKRRALLERVTDGVRTTMLDGVVDDLVLQPDFVSYEVILKDIREREKDLELFTRNESWSLFPWGPRDGYGCRDLFFSNFNACMIDAAEVAVGTYNASIGAVTWNIFTDQFEARVESVLKGHWQDIYDYATGEWLGRGWPDVTVRWRPEGGGEGDWVYLRDALARFPEHSGWAFNVFRMANYSSVYGEGVLPTDEVLPSGVHLGQPKDGSGSFPTDGQRVEVQVLSAGPATELTPFVFDGNPGDLIQRIVDGELTVGPPGMRFDAVCLQDFIDQEHNARLWLTEPDEDAKTFIERELLKPYGWAPALRQDGSVCVIPWEFPDDSVVPVVLDEDNTNADTWAWRHSGQGAISEVAFTYYRMFMVEADTEEGSGGLVNNLRSWADSVFGTDEGTLVLVQTKETRRVVLSPFKGEKIEYKQESIRVTGTAAEGVELDNYGEQLFLARLAAIRDRFLFGAPEATVLSSRRDPDVEALEVGDWVVVMLPWIPSYGAHRRGDPILAQVVQRQDKDYNGVELRLSVAGPETSALLLPTLGAATYDPVTQIACINVTATPPGTDVEVQYAFVEQGEPAPTASGAWHTGERVPNADVPTTVCVQAPDNATVWWRARAVAPLTRPSGWTLAVSVDSQLIPALLETSIVRQPDGWAIISWRGNNLTAGVRSSFPAANTDLCFQEWSLYVSPEQLQAAGDAFEVTLEPWSACAQPGGVSGTAGTTVTLRLSNTGIETAPAFPFYDAQGNRRGVRFNGYLLRMFDENGVVKWVDAAPDWVVTMYDATGATKDVEPIFV